MWNNSGSLSPHFRTIAQNSYDMMESVVKGGNATPAVQTISLEQLTRAYSTLPGGTPELGEQFSGLVEDFIRGYIDIVQKQGLTNGNSDE